MFGLLSAIAVGGAMGYAKKKAGQLSAHERRERDRLNEVAKLQRKLNCTKGTCRVLSAAIRHSTDPDERLSLGEKLAKHRLAANILAAQVAELLVPYVECV